MTTPQPEAGGGAASAAAAPAGGQATDVDDCCCSCCCCACCRETEGELPEHLKDGDIFTDRSCTDCPMTILYSVFVIGWIVLISVAAELGKPSRIFLPENFRGQLCGEGAFTAKSNFFAPLPSRPSYGFCVSACPDVGSIICNNDLELKIGSTTSKVRNTFYDHTAAQFVTGKADEIKCRTSCTTSERESANRYIGLQIKMTEKKCFWAMYPSKPSLHRCLPSIGGKDEQGKTANATMLSLAGENAAGLNYLKDTLGVGAFFTLGFAEVEQCWMVILIAACTCAAMAAIWIFLLRWLLAPIVYLVILLILGVLIGLGVVFMLLADDLENNSLPGEQGTENQVRLYRAAEYICFLLAAAYVIIMLYMLNRIRIAIAVMEEASRAFGATPSMLLVPVLSFIVLLGWFAFFIVTTIYIQTMGSVDEATIKTTIGSYFGSASTNASALVDTSNISPRPVIGASDPAINVSVWNTHQRTKILHAYNIFAILWTANFCMCLGFFIMCMCVVSWYFSATTADMIAWEEGGEALDPTNPEAAENRPGKDKSTPTGVLCTATCSAICNHLGTVLWGSLLIAIIQAIHAFFTYLEETYLKDMDETTSGAICMKCVHCCLWYIEHIIKVISKNAFIICAIRCTNFCSSAAEAVSVIMANAARISILSMLSSATLALIKFFIVGANVLIAFGLMKSQSLTDDRPVESGLFPMFVIFWMSYAIAVLFLNVYEACIDTIFMCFLIDEAHFKGLFMPTSLKKLVDLFEGAELERIKHDKAMKQAMNKVDNF